MNLKILLVYFMVLGAAPLYAQPLYSDTTILINEVVITDSRLDDFAIGSTIQKIDSATIERFGNQSVGELLRLQSSANIRTYGPGGLSSSSIRGGGSAHTLVLWNGLSIKSPTNGGTNLSALTTNLYDDIAIQYGGSGTLYGSGAVTGILHLSSGDILKERNNIQITGGYGSFDHYDLFASWKVGNGDIASRIKVYGNTTDNDFKYKNVAKFGRPEERQTNAGLEQYGVIHDFAYKTGQSSKLNTSIWYQYNDKDIQTLMTDSDTSRANQTDKDLRISANWTYAKNDFMLKFNNGFFTSYNEYTNPQSAESKSTNEYRKIVNELDNKWFATPNSTVNVGLSHTTEIASTKNYLTNPDRNRFALFLSYKGEDVFNRLNYSINIREEYVDNRFIPLVYSAGFDLTTIGRVHLTGSYSRNYRLPTFNDLFWHSGVYAQGNSELDPESGHSAEIGINRVFKSGNTSLSIYNTYFYTLINDWIVWLPDADNVWMPTNKQQSNTRGIESRVELSTALGPYDLSVKGSYTYTDATMKEATPEGTKSRPLIYVPVHQAGLDVGIAFKKYGVHYSHNIQGERFADNSNTLDAYHLGRLSLNYNLPVNRQRLNFSFTIRNVWNTQYQVMAWYAMPLRNYQFKINYRLNY